MNILENTNLITGVIGWGLIISLLLINDRIKKKHKVNVVETIDHVPTLLPFIGIAWLWSKFQKISKKNYRKEKVLVIGPEIISENSKETTFVMLASRTGENRGVVYKSSEYAAPKDDIWLQGEINGLEILALVHKSNPQKYKLNFDNVPSSQYY